MQALFQEANADTANTAKNPPKTGAEAKTNTANSATLLWEGTEGELRRGGFAEAARAGTTNTAKNPPMTGADPRDIE